jgi:putative Holliday junction resolvase
MKILGIDYGEAKTGLALATGFLAEPWKVLRYQDIGVLEDKLEKMIKEAEIDKVVVGVSEGESAALAKKFGQRLRKKIQVPVEFIDETLSTRDAKQKAIEAGVKRSRRRRLEDAFAAATMLQLYLDTDV